MADAEKAVKIVVALVVLALLASFLVPIAVNEMAGQEEATYTQATGETVELQPGLNATVTSVSDGSNASYEITAGNDTATTTVNVGANDTVTVDGVDVTISPEEATTTNATTTYEYSGTYGWGGGASALWAIIPVMIVLAVFLYVVAVALGGSNF